LLAGHHEWCIHKENWRRRNSETNRQTSKKPLIKKIASSLAWLSCRKKRFNLMILLKWIFVLEPF
jgi:hypothetical protein